MNPRPFTRAGVLLLSLASCAMTTANLYADPHSPADLTVTTTVLRPESKTPPLGANNFGDGGAIEWAANNFISNSGNEPVYWQYMHRAVNVGANWAEIDGPGTSHWELWGNGLFSGAHVRIYRIVDAAGNPLPTTGSYLNLTNTDHVQLVGETTIIPEDDANFPAGGWVVNTYGPVYGCGLIQAPHQSATDYYAVENDQTYWYTVVAVDADGNTSAYATEASVTPQSGSTSTLTIAGDEEMNGWQAGSWLSFSPQPIGGQPPYQWRFQAVGGGPLTPPAGLSFDANSGELNGTPQQDIVNFTFEIRLADNAGAVATRQYMINPPAPTPVSGDPAPPTNVQLVAADGHVTITWTPSPSGDVVAYRVLRSTAPAAQQEDRVYFTDDVPQLHPYDYLVLDKRFVNFDMKLVHPRVRGIGNPVDEPNWYWNADLDRVDFTLVEHPQPIPAEMIDPGETCLRVDAAPGEAVINQYKFIGTDIPGESDWYAYLEPGRQYRAEFWLRQQGLANNGQVHFEFRPLYNASPYPGIGIDFNVTGQWQRFAYDFTAPTTAPPTGVWHYGPALVFNGPGSLWIDNCRVYRWDSPAARDAIYTPNATVFDELVASQPPTGPKGAHRTWYLEHDATMDHILSWHANSRVQIDWNTAVSGTFDMTLPMGLEFDYRTGDSPETRMRPWFVLQHILHSEQDWLNLIEYLAAPYDPATDTPESKPYAYRRFLQRGVGAPWTDEFAEIIIEFGNETWHNGVFDNWIGFHLYHWVHAGGSEYGLFSRYLVDVMHTSPYWQSEDLKNKIRFSLGGNYDGYVDQQGDIHGYAEEAMLNCPDCDHAGHANYVGPKWETGDPSYSTFDDHGVQETLVGFLTNVEANQQRMRQARERAAELGIHYDMTAYEGGPSGYSLPGTAGAAQVETSERYGKSLAMAVACLDGWMRSYRDGWTHQCFLGYAQGEYWSSHTPIQNGFRPSPGWLALAMRNRFGGGHLLDVAVNITPTYERTPGEELPLIGAYAMRDRDRWCVMVVSRKLDGEHDGVNFGDGYSPVTLHLPFDTAASIALHKLTGDPRASNRFAMNIDIQSETIPAASLNTGTLTIDETTGGGPNGMPPGSIFMYTFETSGVPVPGDCDGDNDVDLQDLSCFQRCYSGAGAPYDPTACAALDADNDADIDTADWYVVLDELTGP